MTIGWPGPALLVARVSRRRRPQTRLARIGGKTRRRILAAIRRSTLGCACRATQVSRRFRLETRFRNLRGWDLPALHPPRVGCLRRPSRRRAHRRWRDAWMWRKGARPGHWSGTWSGPALLLRRASSATVVALGEALLRDCPPRVDGHLFVGTHNSAADGCRVPVLDAPPRDRERAGPRVHARRAKGRVVPRGPQAPPPMDTFIATVHARVHGPARVLLIDAAGALLGDHPYTHNVAPIAAFRADLPRRRSTRTVTRTSRSSTRPTTPRRWSHRLLPADVRRRLDLQRPEPDP